MQSSDSEEILQTVQSCLEEVATEKLRQCLQDLHPVDVAEEIGRAHV